MDEETEAWRERENIVQDHTCPDPVPSSTQHGAGGSGEPVVLTDLIMLSDTLKVASCQSY